jgi:hypothetical protein
MIASPEGSIIADVVILEAQHLLRQFEVFILQGIWINTFSLSKVDDIQLGRVTINYLLCT